MIERISAVISVSGLTKRYHRTEAILNLNFKVNKGEIVGFLGPNGAGKTTTMRILAGALPASSGNVVIAGCDIFERPIQAKRKVGYLPEHPPLYDELDVSSYLRFVARLKEVKRKRIKAEMQRVIETCGLESVVGRLIADLSKGFRQRLGLAQALIGDPEVLVLDEPTVGLDPNQMVAIRSVIQSLAKNHTVILSTHILPEVVQLCHRVVIIHQGRIVANDSVDKLTSENRSLEQSFLALTQFYTTRA
jgi:ABC-2 type transport system ATP-binding protein